MSATTARKIPCPLNDEQCQQLEQILADIPAVLELVKDCKDCEMEIPHAEESLLRSQAVLMKLRDKVKKWQSNSLVGG